MPAPAPGAAHADRRGDRRADPGARPLPHAARAGRGASAARSRRSSRASSPATPTPRCPWTPATTATTAPPPMLDAIGVDDENLEHVEIRESIKPLLDRLDPREKKILLLRFFKNMTQSQIAEEIGVSQMHVSRLLTRTLEQLRDARWRTTALSDCARRLGPSPVERASMLAGCRMPDQHDHRGHGEQRPRPRWSSPPRKLQATPELDQLGEHDRAARPGPAAGQPPRRTRPAAAAVRREEQRGGHAHRRRRPADDGWPASSDARSPTSTSALERRPATAATTSGGGGSGTRSRSQRRRPRRAVTGRTAASVTL